MTRIPEHKYVVIETWSDGSIWTWGPFSYHRADMAVDALRARGDAESVRAMPLIPSSTLDRELPDWKRDVRV